jgi:hypothetical protein
MEDNPREHPDGKWTATLPCYIINSSFYGVAHGKKQSNRIKMKKVRVKFCGGCNPHIDRGKVYRKIRELLDGEGFQFTVEEEHQADLLLLIDGCPTSCNSTESEIAESLVVRIAGESVNMEKIKESDIAGEAVKAIRSQLQAKAH